MRLTINNGIIADGGDPFELDIWEERLRSTPTIPDELTDTVNSHIDEALRDHEKLKYQVRRTRIMGNHAIGGFNLQDMSAN